MDTSGVFGENSFGLELLFNTTSVEQLKAVFDAVPSSVVIVNADGQFLYVNKRGLELYGIDYSGYDMTVHISKVKALKLNGELFPLEDMPVSHSLKSGQTVRNVEMIIENVNDIRYTVNVSSSPLHDNQGNINGAIVIFEDFTERKQKEKDLIEMKEQRAQSEEKYCMLFNSIDQGFFLIDVIFDENDRPVDMYYVEANEAATKMLGRDYTGRRLRDINPNYEEYWFEIFGKVALTGQNERMELYAEPDKKWYSFNIFRIGDEKSHRIGNIFLDITAQRQTETELIEAKERLEQNAEDKYRALVDSIDQGVNTIEVIFDEQDKPIDCRILEINPAYTKMTGLQRDIVGKGFREFMPTFEEHIMERYGRIALTGEPNRFEEYVSALDSWFDCYAFRVGDEGSHKVTIVFKNITERKKEEDKIKFQAHLINNVHDAIIASDENYTITYWNRMAENMFGWTAGEAIGKHSEDLLQTKVPGCSRESGIAKMFKDNYYDGEAIYKHKDGSEIYTVVHATVIRGNNGRVKEVISSFRDITRQRWVEKELTESEKRQSFQLKLSDALRPLANPKEIQAISVRLLGEHLAANHVHYAEVVGDYVIVHHAYGNGLPPMIGRFRYMDFGERLIATYRSGKTAVCYDIDLDPTITKDEAAVLRGSGIRAYVAVPLVKHGEWVTVLGVDSMEPRAWTADEVKLVEEVAERTWAAVERARAEEKLRESEAKLRGIMEQLPVGVSHYNLDGQILLSNSYYSSLIPEKMPSRDLERMNYWSAMDDEGHALHPDQWPGAKSLRGETVVPGIEFSYADLSGQKKWFLVSASPFRSNEGEVTGGIAVTEDITERKRAEEALQESKKKYHTLFDSIDEGFCIIEVLFDDYDRPLDYRVCEVNQAFQRQTGLVDAVGRWMRDLAPDHEQHWFDIYGRIALTGESVRFQNPADALGRFYDVYAFRIGEPNQRRVAVIFNDISARKRIEETLKESEKEAKELVEKLEEADKNKNKFISVLSHELRNPLAAIVTGLSLLEISEDKQQRERAEGIINRQIKQLCKLVDDLLDLTRITQNKIFLKKETVELNELVNKSVQDYQSQFTDKNVRVEVQLTAPIFIEIDSSRTTQVIGNLLHNASKFTRNNDLVTITVSHDTNSNEAVITVQDTGCGINPNVLKNLFEPFTQADQPLDRSHGGLGLGLAIVKGMLELHGGRVEAFSEGIDKGARFTIWLPLPKENIEEQECYGGLVPMSHESLTILMIEDNKDLTEIMCELIGFLGHKASAVHSGTEGIAKARELRPDVIICDIGLPGMSGYEVAKNIREDAELQGTYLIAMSGYAQPEDIARSKRAGFDRHLGKPASVETFQIALNEVK